MVIKDTKLVDFNWILTLSFIGSPIFYVRFELGEFRHFKIGIQIQIDDKKLIWDGISPELNSV